MQLSNVWSTLRGVIRENLSFSQMKDLAGAVGLPAHRLGQLQQGPGGASKGQLMDGIDRLFNELEDGDQQRVVASAIAELLRRAPGSQPQLDEILARVGWGISDGQIHPLSAQIDLDTSSLPEAAREGVKNCLRRHRDGDISGAVTAICGVVDAVTEEVYRSQNLGDHRAASYQERINRSVATLEQPFQASLKGSPIDPAEVTRIWQNLRQACNQAGYVLATFRREFSDAHGVNRAPRDLVQRAIDCAVFIVRTIVGPV